MKWFLAIAAAAVLAGFVYWQRQAVKVSYVNGLATYNQLPGREYIFQRDCYIFTLDDHRSSWPLVGDHEVVPALPAAADPANVGQPVAGARLIDFVRVGSRFKLVSVRRDESRTGTSISFEILFLDEAERKYPRLDAYFIMDHTPETRGEAPGILERYAVQRVKF